MTHRPLYGHDALRAKLARSARASTLPTSLLFSGPRGVGKQRLALWLAQLLLCDRVIADSADEPCGLCQHCRYALRGVHPDVHWYFPRPKPEGKADLDDIRADMAEATAERLAAEGLWTPPSGTEGIYIDTTRAIVKWSTKRPAMAKRSVIVVGDAERMVSQEGSDQAANAFFKLLEEPPPDTTIVLTTSEPGALLPTIKSRVVSARVAPLTAQAMTDFLADAAVQRRLSRSPSPELVRRGAPGELLVDETAVATVAAARRLLNAALATSHAGTADRANVATRLGVAGARGAFSDTLDSLTQLLHERTREHVFSGQLVDARRAACAVMVVEATRIRAQNNISPQLLGASLLASLHRTLRP